jgi:hypothetical protein
MKMSIESQAEKEIEMIMEDENLSEREKQRLIREIERECAEALGER